MEQLPVNDQVRAFAHLVLAGNLMSASQAVSLVRQSQRSGGSLAAALREQLTEAELIAAIAAELGYGFYDFFAVDADLVEDPELVRQLGPDRLKTFTALPLRTRDGQTVIVTADPESGDLRDFLSARLGNKVTFRVATRAQVQNKLAFLASMAANDQFAGDAAAQQAPGAPARSSAAQLQPKSPTEQWLDATLARAVAQGASDLHLLHMNGGKLLLRLRVDGALANTEVPAGLVPGEVVGSLLARCDTIDSSNRREPQDGTFSFAAAGRQIDARVAMLPQAWGPTVVVRLLDSANIRTRLDDMGFFPEQLGALRTAAAATQGTIVVTGPTGSGKSTTLYGLLRETDAVSRNVLTVEDPIEYRLPFLGQTEVRSDLGDRSITFARALRSILRLDPDVILVGEVRDAETATVTTQAAITGHLVLTTLHASSAVGAFSRLINMGLPPYLVAEAVSIVSGQRLMRRIHSCAQMGTPTAAEAAELRRLGLDVPDQVARPRGCSGCNDTGYRGRLAVAEVYATSPEFRQLIMTNAGRDKLTRQARSEGMLSIGQAALRHVAEGRSTVDELLRVAATVGIDGEDLL
jgi:type II secretory ATPase GspE/PulE/Tfp pilus assembly ATPase PilB-like protein